MQVGRIEVDVREAGVVQPSRAEGGHHLVQAGADARDLRFGDARVDPECSDQVVDGAGGHASDVGLHHHGVQRLVDTPAGLEDQREERTLAQLRDSQVDVTGLRGQHPWPRTVALVGAGLGPLVTGGTDELRGFGLDEFLQYRADRLADQIDRLAGA